QRRAGPHLRATGHPLQQPADAPGPAPPAQEPLAGPMVEQPQQLLALGAHGVRRPPPPGVLTAHPERPPAGGRLADDAVAYPGAIAHKQIEMWWSDVMDCSPPPGSHERRCRCWPPS